MQGFLNKLSEYRESIWLNSHTNKIKYPKVVFAGLGEPLLHPEIVEILKLTHNYGFETELVTNGLLLDNDLAEEIVKSNLETICISLHSLNSSMYYKITGQLNWLMCWKISIV